MTREDRILIVDDDTAFLDMYTDILREEGHVTETASDRAAALAKLDRGGWSTVLLDQKLQGPHGPDSGLDLIEEALQRCPGAQIIVITGYATADSVTRAYQAGAYDFLEKTEVLPALLRLKLRGAQSLHRAQQPPPARPALEELWRDTQTASNPQRKGKLLEDLTAALFRGVPELGSVVHVNRKSDIEEIDLIIRNECVTAPWNRESTYFLVECKNWSRPTDRPELDVLTAKLRRRSGRCSVGFLVSPGGFTQALRDCARRDAHQEPYVILLARPEIEELIAATDRMAVLSRLHMAATMGDASK
jgi:ActR/RegA family two-component response regulator